MFTYSAYGLFFKSQLYLPGFRTADGCGEEVNIFRRKKDSAPTLLCKQEITAKSIEGGVSFEVPFRDLRYEILKGREISVYSPWEQPSEYEYLPLYGFAIASVLHQQKYLVLHASAVEIGQKAIIVLGGKTHGKSTLVAGLVRRGHRLISDDVVACCLHQNQFIVLPGSPCIKLWPSAMEALGLSPEDHPKLFLETEKRNFCVANRFCPVNRSIGGAFLINYSEKHELVQLKSTEKLFYVLDNVYLNRFQNTLSFNERADAFTACAKFIRNINVIKLDRPPSLKMIDITCNLIEDYMRRTKG